MAPRRRRSAHRQDKYASSPSLPKLAAAKHPPAFGASGSRSASPSEATRNDQAASSVQAGSSRAARYSVGSEQLVASSSGTSSDARVHTTPAANHRRIFTGAREEIPAPATPDFYIESFNKNKSGKYSPPTSASASPSPSMSRFGWLGKGTAGAAMPTPSSPSRLAKRTDSVALSQAEGGAFLADVDGEDYLDNGPTPRRHGANTATAFPHSRNGPLSFVGSLLTRRLYVILFIIFACVVLFFGAPDRRKEVWAKAGDAFGKGWDKTEEYIDKAVLHKGEKEENELLVPPGSRPHDDSDHHPHVIEIPPMGKINNGVTSGTKGEASILDAVRKAPAKHADKLKTTRCEKPASNAKDAHGQQRPLVQYAIMIDAGSTGSRVHVYKFNFCKESPELEDEVFEMRKGGLSAFKADAKGAADSLRPLLKTALDAVPDSLRGCTPISVKATAGLRLLGPELSKNILDTVRHMLESEYPFPIADGPNKHGIEIMEGRDEGVFAWITVNYLLGRIGSDGDGSGKGKVQTAAVMDLGGASTQIVFEPIYESATQGMHPGEHVYELSNFGGRKYTLYQNSYLGYGLMEARKSINSLTYVTYSLSHPDKVRTGAVPAKLEQAAGDAKTAHPEIRVPSPCFAEGREKKVKIRVPGQTDEMEVTMTGSAGGYKACKRLVEVMMDKDAVCKSQPCSFAGVYQPSLMTAFANSPIVALSYFFDRLAPLGLKDTFTLQSLVELTGKVCVPPKAWPEYFDNVGSKDTSGLSEALRELEDRPESCLDLTFLTTLLRLGYELDDARSITVAKKLGGNELGWCLGAELQVLQDGVVCKKR